MLRLMPDKTILGGSNYSKVVPRDRLLGVICSEPIESMDGWTVRDLMELIEPFGATLGEMAWCQFDAFYREMNATLVELKEDDPIDYIQISRSVNIQGGKIFEYPDVHGVNESITEDAVKADIEANGYQTVSRTYAIEFTPINQLAKKPIKIDDAFNIRNDAAIDKSESIIFSGVKPFYLLDIIYALLWEISFAGSPEERDAQIKEMDEQMEGIKNGTISTISSEEFLESIGVAIDPPENALGIIDIPSTNITKN